MSGFLKEIPGLTVLHNDNPVAGKRGFVAYLGEGDEEKSVNIEYQEYKEPSVIHDVTDENINIILQDISIDRFYRCNLAKELKVLYIRRVNVESNEESYGYRFSLGILKKHSDKVRDLIKKE